MASPVVQEFAALLQSLRNLKPPGVNKSKVEAITKIATSNENLNIDRRTLVDEIASAFRSSPATHKLGVFYIVDSITRQWIATTGPHSAGVVRMTEALPTMIEELLATIPEAQKERTGKLVDIWISSKSFPADILTSFKQRLAGAPTPAATNGFAAQQGTAPVNGHAPQDQKYLAHQAVPPPTNTGATSYYGAPASIPQVAPPPPVPSVSLQNGAPPSQQPGMMQYSQPVNPAPVTQYQSNVQAPPQASEQKVSVVQPAPAPPATGTTDPQQQLQLLQQLAQILPPEQLAAVITQMGFQLPAPAAPPVVPQVAQPVVAQPPQIGGYDAGQNGQTGYDQGRNNQDNQARFRDRSRSPDAKRRRVTPPNRRDSPTYGVYDPNIAQNESGRRGDERRGDRGRGNRGNRNEFRRRSPPKDRPASPGMIQRPMQHKLPGASKPVGHDYNLGPNRIKVLSRTLFIGGVKSDENQLMDFMARFAHVQSCIVNQDKRHAFLKLITHQDAIAAKTAVEQLPEPEYRAMFERINWAVGFGPTQYADYNLGESILPIDVLTDADKKWLRSAEYGGTGGPEITPGMVVEEPDIEIGAGPSSKAISRRGNRGGFGNRGGHRGGRDNRNDEQQQQPRREQRERRYEDRPPPPRQQRAERHQQPMDNYMPEPVTVGPPPPVPTFGAPLPGFPYNFH
ncbi:hypothetical protein EG328_005965 [Venturia inaequalis]|uniref:CID domain-containing protein n=1 Tax=Venturia inaequalis TaxID=5025 RepID=A0A8H3UIP1_VENIN|nr:hypothetical protein EG328_005965 [Venturia inaequalis]RDI87636.1 hypothetical protein Vi05172_g2483 [Venturia inaequalis]